MLEHAQRVLDTEGRLRHLLAATTIVVEELELSQVLRRIAEVAVALVDARYGALGVIAPDGTLEQFIHVGMSEADAEAIGHLPEGHGLLGAVIDTGTPIRLEDLHDDSRSVGFPAHHPPMDSFLGVPIRVRDEVFGNLYLTNRSSGPFSSEDQELVTALAATAGIAIENARLFGETRRRQRWSAALAEVSSALLSGSSENMLHVVADRVASLVDADLVSVVIPSDDGEAFLVDTARGEGAEALTALRFPAAGSISARAVESGRAIATDDSDDGVMFGGAVDVGPVIAVPLAASGKPLGVLTLCRRRGSLRFTEADLEMASEFATQASVALELARMQADSRKLELIEDRNRIARDLHDHVIQQLFATGLTLQSVAASAGGPERTILERQVEAIDDAISEIRTAVFTLRTRSASRAPSLRHRVLDLVGEVTESLESAPRLTFGGAVDLLVAEDLADDVVAVARELLSNVVRHAQAATCALDLRVTDAELTLRVEDDGQGLGAVTRRSGLDNLGVRARQRGGTFEVADADPHGTVATWSVPLSTTPNGADA